MTLFITTYMNMITLYLVFILRLTDTVTRQGAIAAENVKYDNRMF